MNFAERQRRSTNTIKANLFRTRPRASSLTKDTYACICTTLESTNPHACITPSLFSLHPPNPPLGTQPADESLSLLSSSSSKALFAIVALASFFSFAKCVGLFSYGLGNRLLRLLRFNENFRALLRRGGGYYLRSACGDSFRVGGFYVRWRGEGGMGGEGPGQREAA